MGVGSAEVQQLLPAQQPYTSIPDGLQAIQAKSVMSFCDVCVQEVWLKHLNSGGCGKGLQLQPMLVYMLGLMACKQLGCSDAENSLSCLSPAYHPSHQTLPITSTAAFGASPQYATPTSWSLNFATAFTRPGSLAPAAHTNFVSLCFMTYSMAFSPRVSYSGTHSKLVRLQPCRCQAADMCIVLC